MAPQLTCDSAHTGPSPCKQQHDTLAYREDMRSLCCVAGNMSHTQCNERAIVKTDLHQEFWIHSHYTPDNTADIQLNMVNLKSFSYP